MSAITKPLVLVLFFLVCAGAQDRQSKPPSEGRSVLVGVALLNNMTPNLINQERAQSDLVRSIKALGTDKKTKIVIVPVVLKSSKTQDALEEAAKLGCSFVVTTEAVETTTPSNATPPIIATPGGVEREPVIVGNRANAPLFVVRYAIFKLGSPQPLAQGVTAAPDDTVSSSPVPAAMDLVAHRVASELRKYRPTAID